MNEERRNANQHPTMVVEEEEEAEQAPVDGRFAEWVASFQADVAAAHVATQDGLLVEALAYLDVTSLVQKKQVSCQWERLCSQAIDQKCGNVPQPFRSNDELRTVVRKYIKTIEDPKDAEEIAKTYGWPIGRWDVSQVEDFSHIFDGESSFNEDISAWDTNRATNMKCMFYYATSFNQPIADWNTSNVTNMYGVFCGATSFHQPIGNWSTSNVKNMSIRFFNATSFNQPLAEWDTSRSPTC